MLYVIVYILGYIYVAAGSKLHACAKCHRRYLHWRSLLRHVSMKHEQQQQQQQLNVIKKEIKMEQLLDEDEDVDWLPDVTVPVPRVTVVAEDGYGSGSSDDAVSVNERRMMACAIYDLFDFWCIFQFHSSKSVENLVIAEQQSIEKVVESTLIGCAQCTARFHTRTQMLRHFRATHSNVDNNNNNKLATLDSAALSECLLLYYSFIHYW